MQMRVLGREGAEEQRGRVLGFVCYEYEVVVFVYWGWGIDKIKLWSFRGISYR